MDAAESLRSEAEEGHEGTSTRKHHHKSQVGIGEGSLGERKCTACFLQAFEGYGDLNCNHVAIWGGDGMNWEGGLEGWEGPVCMGRLILWHIPPETIEG